MHVSSVDFQPPHRVYLIAHLRIHTYYQSIKQANNMDCLTYVFPSLFYQIIRISKKSKLWSMQSFLDDIIFLFFKGIYYLRQS